MNSFVTTVLHGIHFSSDLLLKKCEILIAAFADKSVTTTEKQNKLEQITTAYRSRAHFVF